MLTACTALLGCQFDGSNTSALAPAPDAATATEVDADVQVPQPDAEVEVTGTYSAYWSFDVDASDATGNHNGALEGEASITSDGDGFRGEALELSGDGARMNISNPAQFDFNTSFTWHAYIQTEDSSGGIFARNPSGTRWNQGSKALFLRSRSVQWDSGWVSNPRTQVQVDDGEWHQVIATYDASNDQLNVYVDPSPGTAAGNFSGEHDVNRYDEHSHEHLQGIADTGFFLGGSNISDGFSDIGTLEGGAHRRGRCLGSGTHASGARRFDRKRPRADLAARGRRSKAST